MRNTRQTSIPSPNPLETTFLTVGQFYQSIAIKPIGNIDRTHSLRILFLLTATKHQTQGLNSLSKALSDTLIPFEQIIKVFLLLQ
jgi:hypothetical protein